MADTTKTFENVRSAGRWLAEHCNIDPYNAVDCIYKALRTTGKTHGFIVTRDNSNIVLKTFTKAVKK